MAIKTQRIIVWHENFLEVRWKALEMILNDFEYETELHVGGKHMASLGGATGKSVDCLVSY